uniref:ATP synthase complex subunit 8 n=1 Tax=Bactrurus brachycaudus TaxID=111554 RepID=A0A6C0X4U2_9CRUS|nr:ATP synthase F0 subunit 8 [Bactrurus brachycaudus]QIC54382.1 ATP synthase F0 subunit 8 [Bactrurus brachycaudus]
MPQMAPSNWSFFPIIILFILFLMNCNLFYTSKNKNNLTLNSNVAKTFRWSFLFK